MASHDLSHMLQELSHSLHSLFGRIGSPQNSGHTHYLYVTKCDPNYCIVTHGHLIRTFYHVLCTHIPFFWQQFTNHLIFSVARIFCRLCWCANCERALMNVDIAKKKFLALPASLLNFKCMHWFTWSFVYMKCSWLTFYNILFCKMTASVGTVKLMINFL